MSLTKVEDAIRMSSYVDMVMLYGKTGGDFCVALIVPARPALTEWAKTNAPDAANDYELMRKNTAVIAEVYNAAWFAQYMLWFFRKDS